MMGIDSSQKLKEEKHLISLFVNNKPGVLIRIALVFSRRGYNIDSLVTHATHDPQYSMITIGATGEKKPLELIIKQLYKLVDVIDVKDRTDNKNTVTLELCLIKCKFSDLENRNNILHLANSLNCEILYATNSTIIIKATGDSTELDDLENVFASYGIIEIIRTGAILMVTSDETTA